DRVAIRLELDLEIELRRVDFAMTRTAQNGIKVPLIFIESENAPESAVREVRTLCCLATPVKVLMTVAQWDETPGVWKRPKRSHLIERWTPIVKAFAEVCPFPGVLGIIIGEWIEPNGPLKFYSLEFEPSGALRDQECLVVRNVS
ncbi:MAG: hypothetical protein ACREJ9_12015, partial [Candidatus Rokuibacteriota bacterium]